MSQQETLRMNVAKAIYRAAFDPENSKPGIPSPGWCWEKTSDGMREYCLRQADFAFAAIEESGFRIALP